MDSDSARTHLVLGHAPRSELLPGAFVDLTVPRGGLDLVDDDGGDAGGVKGLHELGVGLDLPGDHDLELVPGPRFAESVVENQGASEISPVGEEGRPYLGGVVDLRQRAHCVVLAMAGQLSWIGVLERDGRHDNVLEEQSTRTDMGMDGERGWCTGGGGVHIWVERLPRVLERLEIGADQLYFPDHKF